MFKVWVKIKGCLRIDIFKIFTRMKTEIFKVKHLNRKEIEVLIYYKDYLKTKKYLDEYQITLVKYQGLKKIIQFVTNNKIFLCSLIIAFGIIFVFSHLIIDIEIIHNNKDVRLLVKDNLENYGVKKFAWQKSFSQLSKIKDKIIQKNPNKIEWLEIEQIGMKYIVHIEERIIKKSPAKSEQYCHVVANKNAVITKIIAERGEIVKRNEDYVNEDDIVISGSLMLNEDVQRNICAKGQVYGEVWYQVNVKTPLNYTQRQYTGQKRYNLYFKTNTKEQSIFRNKFSTYTSKKRYLFSLFGIKFYFEQELETHETKQVYTKKEALAKSFQLAREKVLATLQKDEKILHQKVLHKTINNSTMELEIFTSVERNISKTKKFTEEPAEMG